MEYYAGIDVSLEWSSVCIVNAKGDVMKEIKVASNPEALVAFFRTLGLAVRRNSPGRLGDCGPINANRSRGRTAVAVALCRTNARWI
jgi:hypothetical protein